ncbi:hypothetical protein EYW49_20525 [Siculibacillus lacustris]|uniref:DUF2313 domain-containing protein n=1 Tax=Siculibacillus lacustris TaxID=1549641 RepID=A0A4V2KSL5_9HYPH|nr:hypothetical protein [Siculibacillus lacustris]TBW33347.1 hypothetical protein EYW49_20525 [Siculibacillus lacustris]
MDCSSASALVDRCPSLDEVHASLLASLPRGRAWPRTPGSVLWRFWRGVADVFTQANDRLCSWQAEFFCRTADESLDDWWIDYGLPDGCDPFPDLCSKVVGSTGGRCVDLQALAARAGWSISCVRDQTVGAGCFQAGCSSAGNGVPMATIVIAISLSASPAYGGAMQVPFLAGNSAWGAGQPLGCGPDVGPLICLLSRVIPAHVATVYEVV